jgi:hypothetical protein
MAKKGLKFMTPDTAEQMALDYEEARVISLQQISAANKGKVISEEQRKKLSESNKGKKRTDEERVRISERQKGKKHPHKGHKLTDDIKRKISESKQGKPIWSDEDKAKMSEERTGRTNSEFGKLFHELYHINMKDNLALYYREHKYYQRHGRLKGF